MHKITFVKNSLLMIVVLLAAFFAACGAGTEQNLNVNVNAGMVNSTPVGDPPSVATSRTPKGTVSPTPSMSPLPPDAKGVQAAIDVVQKDVHLTHATTGDVIGQTWSLDSEGARHAAGRFTRRSRL